MTERECQALEAARHELVTLNGLMALDGPARNRYFRINTTAAIAELDVVSCDGHWSDCAVHNTPAYPAGPCNCGGLELTTDPRHVGIPSRVAGPRASERFCQDGHAQNLVQGQEMPAGTAAVGSAPAHLEAPERLVAGRGDAVGVGLDDTKMPVVKEVE